MIAALFLSGMLGVSASKNSEFGKAFANARKEKGPGKDFGFEGKVYNTNYANEKASPASSSGGQNMQNLESNVMQNIKEHGVEGLGQKMWGGGNNNFLSNMFGGNNQHGQGSFGQNNNSGFTNMFGGNNQHDLGNFGQNDNIGSLFPNMHNTMQGGFADSESEDESRFGKFKKYTGNYLGKFADLGVDTINNYADAGDFGTYCDAGVAPPPNFGKRNVESFKDSIRSFANPKTGSKYFNKKIGNEFKNEWEESKEKMKNFSMKDHLKESFLPNQMKAQNSNVGPKNMKFGGSNCYKFQNKFNQNSSGSRRGMKNNFNKKNTFDSSDSSDSSDF